MAHTVVLALKAKAGDQPPAYSRAEPTGLQAEKGSGEGETPQQPAQSSDPAL